MNHRPRTRRAAVATALAAGIALATPVITPAAVARPTAARAPVTVKADACDPFGDPKLRASVPTAPEVIGMELGEEDVTVEQSDQYLQAISDASPRVVDGVLGRSWNGRPLRYAVVGKKRFVTPGSLRTIGRNLNRLRDADTPRAVARRIIRRTPAVLWVAGNVHGNEESGTDASLKVLYELAARRDCAARQILDRAIVVVLPTQNPDGREADTRRNAYNFDMNRDWFARTQPETQGKVDKLRELPPQVFIDAHEMGRETYFFPPNADPVYHEIGETPLDWIYNLYGGAMQDAFERFSIPYFNGNVYDLFYVGYGDSTPTTGFNAAGMTFEKHNGDPADVRLREQYVAIWATLSAAGSRHSLLREWRAEHVRAARQGARGLLEPNQIYWEGTGVENQVPDIRVRHYFFRATPGKRAETQRLVERLRGMDVEVYRLTRRLRVPDFTPYGRAERSVTLPKGTFWVPMDQAQKHWAQAMLNENTYVPFPYFYDVTAFSGPLLNNVPGGYSGSRLRPKGRLAPAAGEAPTRRRAGAPVVGVWQVSETSSSALESAGWLRWYLDRRLGLVYDDLVAEDFTAEGLDDLKVVVIPNGSGTQAAEALGDAGQQALRDWVAEGGRLVTLRNSSALAQTLGVTSAVSAEPSSDIPGSLIRVEVDPASPLARGVGRTAYAMYDYELVWTTPSVESAPVAYPEAGDADWFVSGFEEGAEELHGKAAVVDEQYGEGRVVLFGFEPNYRAFTDGTQKILRNALLGPDPEGTPGVAPLAPRAPAAAEAAEPVSDRMVITVKAAAADRVRSLLGEYGAQADVLRAGDTISFRVDVDGLTGDEHPWAVELGQDVTELGKAVVAVRLP